MSEAKFLSFEPGGNEPAFPDTASNQKATTVVNVFDAAAFNLPGHSNQLLSVDWAVSVECFCRQLTVLFQPIRRLCLVCFLEALARQNLDFGQMLRQLFQARKPVERPDKGLIAVSTPPVDLPQLLVRETIALRKPVHIAAVEHDALRVRNHCRPLCGPILEAGIIQCAG